MTIGQAILLGIIQGLTEFLPVSSSGHLVLAQAILNVKEPGIAFEIFTHLGTLLAVVIAFRSDLLAIIKSFYSLLRPWASLRENYNKNENLRLFIYIIIGTIPAVVVGVLFKDAIEAAFENPHQVAINLIVTGVILFFTIFRTRTTKPLNFINTLIMGLAQALAILPGISRSGSTISFGLFSRVRGEEAARFSFLLSIPAILGATLFEGKDLLTTGIDTSHLISLVIGSLMAFIFGYLAITSMLKILRQGKLFWFAPYCILAGILGILFI